MFVLVTTAFLLVGASSQAQAVAPPAPPTAPPAVAVASTAPQKKVCHKEQETGSMMPRRVCRMQAEWDAIARASDSNTDEMLRDYRSRH